MTMGCLRCSKAENVEHPGGNPMRFLSVLFVTVISNKNCDEGDINGVRKSNGS